jgi:hypothetical protein
MARLPIGYEMQRPCRAEIAAGPGRVLTLVYFLFRAGVLGPAEREEV